MNYNLDCQYIEPQRLRPFCHKLTREIRPKDCSGCGWYSLRVSDEQELGLGAMVEEDVKRMKREVEP